MGVAKENIKMNCTERYYINNDWLFSEQFEAKMVQEDYNTAEMKEVRIPHTCKELPFHYFDEHIYQMVSGYRRQIQVPKEWKGKKILLTFEGVGQDCQVFLNGTLVGEHHCGYTAFTVDLSDGLVYGETNLLAVRVDSRENLNIPPFGFVIDYMTYGGIFSGKPYTLSKSGQRCFRTFLSQGTRPRVRKSFRRPR